MSSRRRRPRSPAAAPPLEDDNLLSEILLRLPPEPSSLPRASLVSKRWLGLISDPGFSARFRLHHRRNPPLLGFFDFSDFHPTMDPPNRVPGGRIPPCIDDDDGLGCFIPLGCRHGLVLIFLKSRKQILVRDPLNGDKHRVAVPPSFDAEVTRISGAVFRAAGDIQHFRVVLVGTEVDERQRARAIACVYSSETGGWGDRISTPLPSEASASELPNKIHMYFTISVLVGCSLYWLLRNIPAGACALDVILKFDLERQILAVIPVPVDIANIGQLQVMQADGGGLGILFLSKFSAQLWKRETNSDGVASWVLGRTIEIDQLLHLEAEEMGTQIILGFAEDNNVLLLWTIDGLVMLQLESQQFEKVLGTNIITCYHSFESVYTAETGIGGGHDGADLLHNT